MEPEWFYLVLDKRTKKTENFARFIYFLFSLIFHVASLYWRSPCFIRVLTYFKIFFKCNFKYRFWTSYFYVSALGKERFRRDLICWASLALPTLIQCQVMVDIHVKHYNNKYRCNNKYNEQTIVKYIYYVLHTPGSKPCNNLTRLDQILAYIDRENTH